MRAYFAAPLYVWGLMLVTVGPYLWQPYTGKGPPGTYVEAKPFVERAPTAPIVPVRVVTVSYRLDPPIQKVSVHEARERKSFPWSCDTIRKAASGLTRKQQERLARVVRLTDEQKAEAKRCLTRT